MIFFNQSWEELKIEEESEMGSKVHSIIRVPMQVLKSRFLMSVFNYWLQSQQHEHGNNNFLFEHFRFLRLYHLCCLVSVRNWTELEDMPLIGKIWPKNPNCLENNMVLYVTKKDKQKDTILYCACDFEFSIVLLVESYSKS